MQLWVSLGFIGYCWVPAVKVTGKVEEDHNQISYKNWVFVQSGYSEDRLAAEGSTEGIDGNHPIF
jgi:hypothetical protein